MPIHRRLPKRGFKNLFRKHFQEVNTGRLQQAIDAGKLDPAKPVTIAALQAAGVVGKVGDGVRLLANGDLTVKLALEVRPDRVILAGDARDRASRTVDLRAGRDSGLAQTIGALAEGGIHVAARIKPELAAVKTAHTLGLSDVEFYTGDLLDLPGKERQAELEGLGDAARIAAKLHIAMGVAGGLDFANVGEVLLAAPVAGRVVVGRALIARAMLVGIDCAVRDFRNRLA